MDEGSPCGEPGRTGWTVLIERQPEMVLRRLPQDLLQRIDRAILDLAQNLRPQARNKLAGHDNLYCVQVEDWHISYAIEKDEMIVLILDIVPTGSASRNG